MKHKDVVVESINREKSNTTELNIVKDNVNRIVNNIESVAKKGLVFASAFGVLYFVINLISNYIYQTDCEKFYKIPAKYFSKSIEHDLVFIGFAVLLLVISFIPVLIQRYSVKCKTDTRGKFAYMIFLEVIVGMIIGIVNIYYLISIFNNSNIPDLIKNIYAMIIFPHNESTAIVISILLYVTCTILILLESKMKKIRRKCVKKFLYYFLSILILFNLSIEIMGIFSKVATPIADKTSYETISIQNEMNDKYVVLSEYDNKCLCVKYNEEKEHGQKKFSLYTDSYYFISPEEGTYSYIHMKESPAIEKRKNLKNRTK